MKLSANEPKAEQYVVYFNGKPLTHYITASEEDGYIEVIDPSAMAPLFGNEGDPFAEIDDDDEPVSALKVKKIHGSVDIRKLS